MDPTTEQQEDSHLTQTSQSLSSLLFKINLIFKDIARHSCKFKYFSSLREPCITELMHNFLVTSLKYLAHNFSEILCMRMEIRRSRGAFSRGHAYQPIFILGGVKHIVRKKHKPNIFMIKKIFLQFSSNKRMSLVRIACLFFCL